MSSGLLLSAVAVNSIVTSLTVEAIKKLLGNRKYSANFLAVVVSVILNLGMYVGQIVYKGMHITPQNVVSLFALMFLSFLSSTMGYDKVKQMIEQIARI